MFAPQLVAPFRVSCPILHLALLSENDDSGIWAPRIVTILDISIWMLKCPKADKGASSVLVAGL